jgi:uncharacterized protein (DUF1015 family)
MAHVGPFRGLRPPQDLVEAVCCPPYDVVSREEARQFAHGNERSFFHISRPEIDFGPEVGEHDAQVYARGKENLAAFLAQGWLVQDEAPRFYVYRQRHGEHVQTGLVAAASVEEYVRGNIRRHELTRADKEDDRTQHVDALEANDEPVFLAFAHNERARELIAQGAQGVAEYDFRTQDGVHHVLWRAPLELNGPIADAFASIARLYIADGHHRSAAAARVRTLRRERGLATPGQEDFLAVIFPHDELQILAYNRLVKDLAGLSPEAFLTKVREKFEVAPTPSKVPAGRHEYRMFLGEQWYQLLARDGTYPPTPLGSLDVAILQENLLGPVLGIGDPRTDPRISFVGGSRGHAELERKVGEGGFAVAFSLFPTGMDQLLAVADAGQIMPPKSTWFEPKLRSGLVLHPLT